jgi:8-oxo-dGTP diphosphatase
MGFETIAMIIEESTWEERPLTVTWHESSFVPPRELITQASGLCFVGDGSVVLVTADGMTWQLVGGHPEIGETSEEAFRREAVEEACATVTHLAYLGAQEVNDPHNPTGLTTYYQSRFWARVTLGEFSGKHEMMARTCVAPTAVQATLNWRTSRVLAAILQAAFDYENRFRTGTLIDTPKVL